MPFTTIFEPKNPFKVVVTETALPQRSTIEGVCFKTLNSSHFARLD